MRILVVEDEKHLNLILTKRLKAQGYAVDSCLDGNEALKKCGFECIKTILTPNIDTVPFVLQNTNAIYLKASQFTVSGYENVIVTRPLDEKNLLVHKAYVYREDNKIL